MRIPPSYEERTILLEHIANEVMDHVMPARRSAGVEATDNHALVRAIVDKTLWELEEREAENPIDVCGVHNARIVDECSNDGITLDEWVKDMADKLRNFREKVECTDMPSTMLPGDWDEQFFAFLGLQE
jgi:hypothetical protein